MKWISEVRSLPFLRKSLIAIGGTFVLVGIAGFFIVPAILKPVLQNALTDALHRKTVVREIRVNPFLLTATVRGLEVAERDAPGKWISAEEIFADLEIASIFRLGPVLREIVVKNLYVNIVRRPDGSYNFTDLLDEAAKKPKTESKPLKYSFNNIQLINGRVDFFDGPKRTRHVVEGIQFAVPFVSNLEYAADKYVQPSFSAVVNGDAVSLRGRTKPFKESLETVFDINIINLSLSRYLEYIPFRREYEVPSALLDMQASLSFRQQKEGRPMIRVDGYAELRDVRVTGKDKSPMIALPSLRAVVAPSDMGVGEYRLTSLTIRNPELDVVRDENGKLNLLSLIPEIDKEKTTGSGTEKAAPPKKGNGRETVFSIDSIRLSGGKVRFSEPSPFRTVLGDLRVEVDGFSTEAGKTAQAMAALSSEAGETAGVKGTFTMAPVASKGTFTVGRLALAKYAPYYREKVLFDIIKGTLDLQTGFIFSRTPEGSRFRLDGLSASLNDLRLRQREEKEDFLDIPLLAVKDAQVDPDRKEILVGEISTGKGRIAIRKEAGGSMNVSRLVPEGAATDNAPKTAANLSGKAPRKSGEEKPWLVALKKVSVDRYEVRFEDRAVSPPVDLAFGGLRLRTENLTTEKNRKGTFSFATGASAKGYERGGTVSLDGTISMDPFSVAGRLRARNLPMGPLHPYYTEKLRIFVTRGGVNAEGTIRVSAPKGGPLQAGYKGEVSVTGFSSVDKEQGEEFLSFEDLHFGGIDVGYQPTRVAIREIALSDFYSRIIVNDNGTLNVQGIVGKGAGGDNAAAAGTVAGGGDAERPSGRTEGEAVPVRIEAVTMQGGRVNFSDRYVKPNYSANLQGIGGRISGISSEEGRLADVDLRGNLGERTPLEIKGKINPLAKDLFLDLGVEFRDVDLSPLTPYSDRYVGYGIEKGKLSLTLSYHIEKRKLDAKNKVFIDQFTFGEPVESPQATKLPVRLAVSLLKDRNGEIHLDVPVSGNIDDPKFSVWKIIWKVVGNLLVRAATSPFALIGAMFGGGEELSYLEFEPGQADMPAAGAEKMRNLAKALYERPALKLDIEGHSDPVKDPEALRRVLFRRKVAAQKVKELAKAGLPAPALDNVAFQGGEFERYLELAYKEEKFPKPRNFIGMAKSLPPAEVEKLMMANLQVTDGDLRQLAVERAARVRDALVSEGKVEPGRVFLVEPKTLAPAKKEKLKDSRVDFRIK